MWILIIIIVIGLVYCKIDGDKLNRSMNELRDKILDKSIDDNNDTNKSSINDYCHDELLSIQMKSIEMQIDIFKYCNRSGIVLELYPNDNEVYYPVYDFKLDKLKPAKYKTGVNSFAFSNKDNCKEVCTYINIKYYDKS